MHISDGEDYEMPWSIWLIVFGCIFVIAPICAFIDAPKAVQWDDLRVAAGAILIGIWFVSYGVSKELEK